MFNVESCSDASCHGTIQIIRAQVQKQSLERSNFHTWAHIIPVVHEITKDFKPTNKQAKIYMIQHNTSLVITFHKWLAAARIHRSSNKLLQTKFKVAEAT
jgi:hypothetical protein